MKKTRLVKISWLIKVGRLSPMSPTALISEKIGIKWLMMFDDEYVYGPTPGIVEIADLLVSQLKPKTVIDLFGGSGALSKLALRRNVEKVIYVDLYPDAATLNLKECRGIEIVKQDALKFIEKDGIYCDLLFVDPPEELIDEVLSKIGRMRRMIKKAGLIWIGSSDVAKRRIRRIRRHKAITFINAWGDAFMITWKPGFGEKIERIKQIIG
ncbi:MAG: RsmD family RNA methyltransferase [Nitrososphaerota archaeon]|nr:RsmD family RNA methyltransferase [Nitrososphaerota archaeon]